MSSKGSTAPKCRQNPLESFIFVHWLGIHRFVTKDTGSSHTLGLQVE